MATTPSSSTIANLAARRQQVQKARVAIGLSGGGAPNGGMRAGAPINPAGPASPTPSQPAVTAAPAPDAAGGPPTEGAPTNALHPDNVPDMTTRDQALAYTKQMLATQANNGTPVTAPPDSNQGPPSVAPPILDQIQAVGAEQMSPTMQFMRVNGRNPSGRELAMFAATSELARQLGRNPTTNELMMYMTRPQAAASPAVIPGVTS